MKIGLALSGGGIRATVFHLGVLARQSLLEKITFLSTASGGRLAGSASIVRRQARRDDVPLRRLAQRPPSGTGQLPNFKGGNSLAVIGELHSSGLPAPFGDVPGLQHIHSCSETSISNHMTVLTVCALPLSC